jgi:polyisoprenoid-binding protein YceI
MRRFICCFLLAASMLSSAQAAEIYKLDKPHTQIIFSVDHLGFVHSFGHFDSYDGGFTMDKGDPSRSTVDVTIHTGSIDMGDPKWNDALKAKGYFDVAEYPDMHFKSTGVERVGSNALKIHGLLTLRGVTKPVTLDATLNKMGQHPFMAVYVAGLSADATIKRSDFGMTAGLPLVGDEVHIHLEVEGNRIPQPGQEIYNQ